MYDPLALVFNNDWSESDAIGINTKISDHVDRVISKQDNW